ncbi:MAG TPA: hypothetical protein VLL51_09135 [Gemmatimonadales bacterium]|nr:hypothetical protein [Gemmatimonadales bacterium]
MVINRNRTVVVWTAAVLLVGVVLALLPGPSPAAAGQESERIDIGSNFEDPTIPRISEEVRWTVVAGERGTARVVCDEGYIVDAVEWEVSGDDITAPPGLKVVSKVSGNQRGVRFAASYSSRFFDIWPEISVQGTVTCLLLPAVQASGN